MKRYYFAAAGTLLLGSSALAWAPSTAPAADSGEDKVAMAFGAGGKMPSVKLVSKTNDVPPFADKTAKAESASWDGWSKTEAKWAPASAMTWDNADALAKADAMAAGDPDLDLAETSIETSQDETELAIAAEQDELGMGGPLETPDESLTTAAAAMNASDLTPRPASGNYPPCRPGPGDDNCIQLYEPGVRTALASWNRPTGGLGDGTPATAMGGPYEPIEEYDGTSASMNGDHLLDTSMGETAQDEFAAVGYTGAGGPVPEDSVTV